MLPGGSGGETQIAGLALIPALAPALALALGLARRERRNEGFAEPVTGKFDPYRSIECACLTTPYCDRE